MFLLPGIIGAFLLWYIFLPAINPRSIGFWVYLGLVSVIVLVAYLIHSEKKISKKIEDGFEKETGNKFSSLNKLEQIRIKMERRKEEKDKFVKILAYIPLVVVLILIGGEFFSSKIFFAKKYSKMLEVDRGNFIEDIEEISFDQIPTVDRITAIKLGDRKMGEMVDLASQFNVSDAYTQIDYRDKAVRVTPLKYNGILKWFNNRREGIPGYITVDMATGHTRLNRLDKNIRYSQSDKFSRDIRRHITKKYPTRIFYAISFEIDEEGAPYWIAPTYSPRIGLFGGMDVKSVIVVDAVTGSMKEYDVKDVPSWIDRVYDADMIIGQIDNWGSLKDGLINSKFSQKGVLVSTEGYNYLAIDDDVYLYTGITSASEDSSNVGFMLSNLRTKESRFYEVSSADEVSAMGSAMGEVQEKEYTSTFPILLNIDDKPTYMMALKDKAELIKAYAFVDSANYQKVSVGQTVEEALAKHLGQSPDAGKTKEKHSGSLVVEDLSQIIIDGNSYYYIVHDSKIYRLKADLDKRIPFLKVGDSLNVEYYQADGELYIISGIK